MTDERIRETFEAFFEKYKKTEGDRSSWSAPWSPTGPGGDFEINLTKCPRGTIFKLFHKRRKLGEIAGWDNFLAALPSLAEDFADDFDPDEFFGSMAEML